MKANGARIVLLVEDDADLREVMAEALALRNIATAVAGNGAEAIGYLRNSPPPALILLDLMMPVMDGFQFRREQQAVPAWCEIPVVVLSADRELQVKIGPLAVAGYLRKPVDFADLVAVIQRYTG